MASTPILSRVMRALSRRHTLTRTAVALGMVVLLHPTIGESQGRSLDAAVLWADSLSGVTLRYPADLFAPALRRGDLELLRLAARGDEATATVRLSAPNDDASVAADSAYRALLATLTNITYRRPNPDAGWYVVASEAGGASRYVRLFSTRDRRLAIMEITWPTAEQARYEAAVATLSHSFRATVLDVAPAEMASGLATSDATDDTTHITTQGDGTSSAPPSAAAVSIGAMPVATPTQSSVPVAAPLPSWVHHVSVITTAPGVRPGLTLIAFALVLWLLRRPLIGATATAHSRIVSAAGGSRPALAAVAGSVALVMTLGWVAYSSEHAPATGSGNRASADFALTEDEQRALQTALSTGQTEDQALKTLYLAMGAVCHVNGATDPSCARRSQYAAWLKSKGISPEF